jgi:hypothetical protein
MAILIALFVRNAMLDAIEAAVGQSPLLRLRSGPAPANVEAAPTGTVIATMQLPTDWMLAAANGAKALTGLWQDPSADAAGTIGHFEICRSDGTPALRGSVTLTGGGGDITLDAVAVNVGQSITITAFTLSLPN